MDFPATLGLVISSSSVPSSVTYHKLPRLNLTNKINLTIQSHSHPYTPTWYAAPKVYVVRRRFWFWRLTKTGTIHLTPWKTGNRRS